MSNIDEMKKDIADAEMETYPFRRDFYYEVKKAVEKYTFTFLLGPKKCGKTVCLKQLWQDYTRAGIKTEYINFKTLNHEAQQEIISNILSSLVSDEPVIYLLDDETHAEYAELNIAKMASEMTFCINDKTKVVFTGTPTSALESWSYRAFCGEAEYVYADFLSYPEYLKYKNISDVSEESYLDYLYNAADFHQFTSLKEYLQDCLTETIISNRNTNFALWNSECDRLTDNQDILVSVCYQSFFSLCDQTGHQECPARSGKIEDIPAYFNAVYNGSNNIAEKIRQAFLDSYANLQETDLETLRQAIVLLYRCDLIAVTPILNDLEDTIPNRSYVLVKRYAVGLKRDLNSVYAITMKHPIFYLRILQDVLGKDMPGPKNLPTDILGSVVACQINGLLSNGFTVKIPVAENGHCTTKTVDYVRLGHGIAVEVAVAHQSENNFALLPDDWYYLDYTLLTRDEYELEAPVKKIPYYEYLYQLGGKEYAEKLKAMRQSKPDGARPAESP